MNKKTFTLAVIFLICALGWLGANVYNEFNKKKCRHLDEVNKHKIP